MKHLLLVAALLAGSVATPVMAYEFNGFRIEGQGGWDDLKINTQDHGFTKQFTKKGWMYGAEGGYDLRLSDTAILGAYGNYNWSTINGTTGNGTGATINADVRNEWSAMGRLGFKISDNTLLYVGAGYAKTKIDYAYTPPLSLVSFDSSEKYGGVRGAVGLEQGLGSNVYAKVEYRYTNYQDNLSRHQIVGGLGIRFGQRSAPVVAEAPMAPPPPPMAAAAPLPPCPPAAVTPGPFLVFFDWNKSALNGDAMKILDSAAAQFATTGQTSVALSGYADTSGTPDYNLALSQRRADAVKAYMASKGVPDGATTASGLGETNLLVQTADGVREPQNRRVELSFGGAPVASTNGACTPQ